MVHWPKSVVGNLFGVTLALVVGLALVQSAIAMSGLFVWVALAVVSFACLAIVVMYRRAQAASDLALVDAPSFGDVLPHWNHPNDLDPPTTRE